MTPDKRLNQIEPELADVIQKVDRLIESNGLILDLAVNTKADLSEVKADLSGAKADLGDVKADLSGAKADLGDVKADLSGVKADLGEVKVDLSGVKTDLGNVKVDLSGVKTDLRGVKVSGESTARAVANLTVATQKQFEELRVGQEQLKAGQELILQILREKLP